MGSSFELDRPLDVGANIRHEHRCFVFTRLDYSKQLHASPSPLLPYHPGCIVDVWAAAGLKDTLLRCEVKPEVVYGNEKAVQPRVQA